MYFDHFPRLPGLKNDSTSRVHGFDLQWPAQNRVESMPTNTIDSKLCCQGLFFFLCLLDPWLLKRPKVAENEVWKCCVHEVLTSPKKRRKLRALFRQACQACEACEALSGMSNLRHQSEYKHIKANGGFLRHSICIFSDIPCAVFSATRGHSRIQRIWHCESVTWNQVEQM